MRWSQSLNADFTLKDRQLKMLTQINILIEDMLLDLIFVHFFHFQILIVVKNVIIFRIGNNSSVHIDNKKEDILVLGKGPKQGLDDTRMIAEAKYSINFSRSGKKLFKPIL